jgi:transcriptional regulator with XRE-family HTH domain
VTSPTRTLKTEHDRLRFAREARNLTQAQLAELARIERLSVSRHENGGSRISEGPLRRYARALGCSAEWLRFGIGHGPGERENVSKIVAEYLASDLGRSTPPWVEALLRKAPYRQLGVRRLSPVHVHRVRELIEMNRALAPTMAGDAASVPRSKPPRSRR